MTVFYGCLVTMPAHYACSLSLSGWMHGVPWEVLALGLVVLLAQLSPCFA